MQRIMMKSKIHRATVTEANLYYEGSITIDRDLMDAADIYEYEQVSIVDINNGERLETYVISGEKGTGNIGINGAAARKIAVGDEVIIISYAIIDDDKLSKYEPTIILVDKKNNIKSLSHQISANTIISNN
ncbi:MAG TPA: aspartate 1-decarboxylase [Candidatus Kapabacteria bacterium]|jgi:aspartate 1-decarboxylase|nr:aspartate 1-decarboxylase [Candidatus Kapabacteria bacterium]HOV93185.1 aspartate 1-decarboxylase [Candidatus Kapabacteria bacterium]